MSDPPWSINPWNLLNLIWVPIVGIAARLFGKRTERIENIEKSIKTLDDEKADKTDVAKDKEDVEGRLRRIETERSEVQVLASTIGDLRRTFESYQNTMDEHHKENRLQAAEDRTQTERWRNDTMAPMLKQLGEDMAASHARIEALQKDSAEHDTRIRDLERRKR